MRAGVNRARAIFVVGAGRSGTSAITRAIQALGVDLGDNLKPPTKKNPTGFFEDADLLRIAKGVRSRLGLRTESVSLISAEAWKRTDLEDFYQEAVRTIDARFGSSPLWGFKYAQTLRMLPFWQEVFERAQLDVRYVVCARNPLSVAKSRARLDPIRGVQEKSDIEWLVNVVPYFSQLARRPFVVVDYDLLMGAPVVQIERIAQWLEIELSDKINSDVREYVQNYLEGGMRHTRFDEADLRSEPRLNPLTRDAYLWLHRLAADEITPDAPELWNDWDRIEREVAAMAPALRHIDSLEAEVRRSSGSPFQRLRVWALERWKN